MRVHITLRSMTGPQAIAILKRLGISQRQFALLVNLHPNAVTKWAKGTEPSGPTRALLALLDERPELIQVLRNLAGEEDRKRGK